MDQAYKNQLWGVGVKVGSRRFLEESGDGVEIREKLTCESGIGSRNFLSALYC